MEQKKQNKSAQKDIIVLDFFKVNTQSSMYNALMSTYNPLQG